MILKDESSSDFSQGELNDLVRDLGPSKDGAELIGSRLTENMVRSGTSFSWYRYSLFSIERNLVFVMIFKGL